MIELTVIIRCRDTETAERVQRQISLDDLVSYWGVESVTAIWKAESRATDQG